MYLALKYALFAAVATLANLASQDVSIRLYNGTLGLYVSIAVGTLVGLAVKYVLDKKYIFYHKAKNAVDDGRMFVLYTLMGVFTTLIFWASEIGFEFAFGTKTMRYIGATLGLLVGYITKYQLDKRFVFKKGAGDDCARSDTVDEKGGVMPGPGEARG